MFNEIEHWKDTFLASCIQILTLKPGGCVAKKLVSGIKQSKKVEKERERESECVSYSLHTEEIINLAKHNKRDGERKKHCLYVCVCVCVRERVCVCSKVLTLKWRVDVL